MPSYLGLDYGLRRIGIAVSDEDSSLAFALETHVEGRDPSILARLDELVRERGVTTVIVGHPLTAAGERGTMAMHAERFAKRLASGLGVKTVLWDERYSSAEADRHLASRKKATKEDRDAAAAQIILQSYLDSLRRPHADQGEEP